MAEVEREAARLLAELDAKHPCPPAPEPEPARRLAQGAILGPSWMPAQEWESRLEVYQRQGRSHAEIRRVAEHLERRGAPPTKTQKIAEAKKRGLVYREEYMSPEEEARALALDQNGLPDARLERVRNRLLVVTPLGWVNPRSRTAASTAGLWSFIVRGTGYHEAAARRGDFRPGRPVRLVREPDNPHDPSAIAVYASGARDLAGYVPRGYAKRLATILDGGADMVAVSTRGSGPGSEDVSPQVLVCERALYEHLTRGSK